tara:strand:+ start:3058 stop:3378 length:321 start_codon:yes stop_codon:yes gene_type:complete
MIIDNLKNFFKGWIIGNFQPSLLKTDLFEIGIQQYKKDFIAEKHYQKIATEYNIILEGSAIVNKKIVNKHDIFIFKPKEITEFKTLSHCSVLSIKIPSVPNDKINV